MPNIRISDLETIAPGFDPDAVFVEVQNTVDGEPASRKATVSELTAGTSPLDATYITVTANAILPNERILTGTAQISVTDGGAGAAITLDIPVNAIDNTFLADMAQATVKGRADGAGTGDPVDLTPSQLNDILASGGFATYFSLTATDRVVGSNAGTNNTGDNVFLANSLAGDNNIADGVIAIGENAFAAAAQLDFVGSIAIGRNAGALLSDTRDPWLIIGSNACAVLPGAGFHDGNTVIGTNALLNDAQSNMQGNTVIGFDACRDIDGVIGSIGSSVVIGNDAGRGTVDGSITSTVLIGRSAGGDLRSGGVSSSVVIGQNAGESMGGASLNVLIGSNCTINAVNIDNSIVLGCNTFAFSGTTDNQIIIGHSAVSGIVTGEKNILIGNSLGITGTQRDFNGCIIIGHIAGLDLINDQDIFAIEQPQGSTSTVARPYLFGNIQEGNLALLNIAAMTGGTELGTRIVPAWADLAPVAGQGVFSMYGAGTDLAATTDADFVHFYVASADSTLTLRYPGGGDVTLLHDGTDAVIQTNIIVGPVADGKLFINTTTGVGPIGSIVSATPGLVSIFGAGTNDNITAGHVDIWGGYSAGVSPARGGDVRIWGGGGGGSPASGGDVLLFGGDSDSIPGDIHLLGGTSGISGDGGKISLTGGPGVGANGGGGTIDILTGSASGTDQGGTLTIGTGAGSTSGIGGTLNIQAGDGGSSGNGGLVILRGGDSPTSGDGGRVQLNSGGGGAASDPGGDIWFLLGQGGAGGASGNLYINSTDGINPTTTSSESPGLIAIFGIDSDGSGVGAGDISLIAGSASSGVSAGGDINLTGGASVGGAQAGRLRITGDAIWFDTNGPGILDEAATATNPTLIPNRGDPDTGIGNAAFDALSLVAGGIEGLRFTELNNGVVQAPSASVAVTAFAGGGQGSATALIHSYNVITVVATAGDSVRLPAVFAVNSLVYIKNNDAAEAADVFPASGDDLGAGVDTAVSLGAGQSLTFMATVANSTWTLLIVDTAGGAGVAGEFDNLLLSQTPGSHAASPTLRFGDGDTGFYESVDDTLICSIAGVANFAVSVFGVIAFNSDAWGLINEGATATNPTLVPSRLDEDSGIGSNAIDELSLIAGSVEGLRLTELSSGIIQAPSASVAVTAFATGGQGSATALVNSYNVITVVGTDGDSVRLPDTFAVNSVVYVKNDDSAQAADVFPASGDNLGAGVDTAVSLAAGESLTFIATVANSTWTPLIVATGGGGAGADSDGARRSVGVPNATGSYIDYTELTVDPPSTGFYTVDITFPWSGNDANITGLDLNWTIGSGATPQSQGTWITTANTAPGGVESTTVDGGSLSGGVMPVASGTVSYVSQFHGIWDVGATLPTDIQLQFRREGSSGTITGGTNASISIRKFAEL